MNESLANLTVVVTGGTSGIGAAIAEGFVAAGSQVLVGARRPPKAGAGSAGNADFCRLDTGDIKSVTRFFDWVKSRGPTIDVLVNAAGTNVTHRSISDTSSLEWEKVMRTNATGVFNSIKSGLPLLRTPGGLIVNLASIAGIRADEWSGAAYIASKHAVIGISSVTSSEFAKRGIRVSAVLPGDVNTPLLQKRKTAPSEFERSQMVQPADIAKIVLMIAAMPKTTHIPEVIVKPLAEPFT